MNKWLTKQVWLQHNVPVASDKLVDLTSHVPVYEGPCVVKALDQGSSVGVWICKDGPNFHNTLLEAKKYGRVMIEEFLEGREITVPVLDNKNG
jgi:D-alanine-D-alanine ligase